MEDWARKCTSNNIEITDTTLREQARVFVNAIYPNGLTFKASRSWIKRFKERHGIVNGGVYKRGTVMEKAIAFGLDYDIEKLDGPFGFDPYEKALALFPANLDGPEGLPLSRYKKAQKYLMTVNDLPAIDYAAYRATIPDSPTIYPSDLEEAS